MSAVFFFSGYGTLEISISYTLSTSVTNTKGETTVAILASLEKFDEFNVSIDTEGFTGFELIKARV